MNEHLKKFASISLAILFGAGIIFFVVKGGPGGTVSFGQKNTGSQDNSWKDSLSIVPQGTPKTLGAQKTSTGDVVEATTTTSLIARELLTNYATAQIAKGNTPLTKADASAVVEQLSVEARTDSGVKTYTEKDLSVVDASASNLDAYKKTMVATLNALAQQKNLNNELIIVAQAVDNNDATKLAPLSQNITALDNLVKDLLAMKVPRSMAPFHLSLVQGFTTVLSGVVDMQQVIADPIRGLRGIAKYKNGVKLINSAVATLQIK